MAYFMQNMSPISSNTSDSTFIYAIFNLYQIIPIKVWNTPCWNARIKLIVINNSSCNLRENRRHHFECTDNIEKVFISAEGLEEIKERLVYLKNTNLEIIEENNTKNVCMEEKKQIALTFDDGPHPYYTEQLLDGLKERKVVATFFVTVFSCTRFCGCRGIFRRDIPLCKDLLHRTPFRVCWKQPERHRNSRTFCKPCGSASFRGTGGILQAWA